MCTCNCSVAIFFCHVNVFWEWRVWDRLLLRDYDYYYLRLYEQVVDIRITQASEGEGEYEVAPI